jgi:hypothetical protein
MLHLGGVFFWWDSERERRSHIMLYLYLYKFNLCNHLRWLSVDAKMTYTLLTPRSFKRQTVAEGHLV